MYYGGSVDDSESLRYTGSAVPPRLSSRPTHVAAADCHPSYAGTPADLTSFCRVIGRVAT